MRRRENGGGGRGSRGTEKEQLWWRCRGDPRSDAARHLRNGASAPRTGQKKEEERLGPELWLIVACGVHFLDYWSPLTPPPHGETNKVLGPCRVQT